MKNELGKTLTIAPDVTLETEELRRIVGHYALPGETVRIAEVKFSGESAEESETRKAPFRGKDMKVAETHVVAAGTGAVKVVYSFEGVEGLHNARAFGDVGEAFHSYGVLITRDAETWFVPFPDSAEETGHPETPFKVAKDLPRSAKFCLAVADDTLAIDKEDAAYTDEASFFSKLSEEPICGEFSFNKHDGETYLAYSPWMSDPAKAEVDAAVAAIEGMSRSPSP